MTSIMEIKTTMLFILMLQSIRNDLELEQKETKYKTSINSVASMLTAMWPQRNFVVFKQIGAEK